MEHVELPKSEPASLQTTIYSLGGRGWSRRRIARELGIDRETVDRHLRLAKPAIPTTGLEEAGEAKPAIVAMPFICAICTRDPENCS
jgi:hypothetical protein